MLHKAIHMQILMPFIPVKILYSKIFVGPSTSASFANEVKNHLSRLSEVEIFLTFIGQGKGAWRNAKHEQNIVLYSRAEQERKAETRCTRVGTEHYRWHNKSDHRAVLVLIQYSATYCTILY